MKYIIIALICAFAASGTFAQDTTSRVADTSAISMPDTVRVAEGAKQVSEEKRLTSFSATTALGFTFSNIDNNPAEETLNLQWLASLQARFSYEGQPYQFGSTLFAQFGQLVTKESPPKKTQDDIILTVIPSMTLSEPLGLRLFLEVTGETDMAKGVVDDTVETNFADPLFLYETLFLGHKTNYQSEDGTNEFQFTIGVGYAFQQTLTNNFVLASNRNFVTSADNPLSSVQDQFTLEKGYSGVLDLFYRNRLSENFSFKTSAKVVALTRKEFFDDISNSRVGGLLLSGFSYKFLSIDYTLRIVYDNNISSRRQLEQTLVFGFKLEI
jgi:hypothetical protein